MRLSIWGEYLRTWWVFSNASHSSSFHCLCTKPHPSSHWCSESIAFWAYFFHFGLHFSLETIEINNSWMLLKTNAYGIDFSGQWLSMRNYLPLSSFLRQLPKDWLWWFCMQQPWVFSRPFKRKIWIFFCNLAQFAHNSIFYEFFMKKNRAQRPTYMPVLFCVFYHYHCSIMYMCTCAIIYSSTSSSFLWFFFWVLAFFLRFDQFYRFFIQFIFSNVHCLFSDFYGTAAGNALSQTNYYIIGLCLPIYVAIWIRIKKTTIADSQQGWWIPRDFFVK